MSLHQNDINVALAEAVKNRIGHTLDILITKWIDGRPPDRARALEEFKRGVELARDAYNQALQEVEDLMK